MKKRVAVGKWEFTSLQVAVHLGAWLLLFILAGSYFTNNLTANPIQAATQRTGFYALVFLTLSLACTPINTLFGLRRALSVRRPLGLYAFLYAAIHFGIFIGLDYGLEWQWIIPAVVEKRYVLVGLLAGMILLLLAITSTKGWMKRLGQNWKRLHKLVYLAAGLAILHYAWANKGDLSSLQGDIVEPLLWGSVVAILLVLRLPILRRWVSQRKGGFFITKN